MTGVATTARAHDGIKWRSSIRLSIVHLSSTIFPTPIMRSLLRLTKRTLSQRCLVSPLGVVRSYATISPDTPPPQTPYEVFDEPSKFRQRDRALIRLRESLKDNETDNTNGKGPGVVDYLREELAERLAERVEVGAVG